MTGSVSGDLADLPAGGERMGKASAGKSGQEGFSADVPNIGRQYWANHFALIFLKGKPTGLCTKLWVGGGQKT